MLDRAGGNIVKSLIFICYVLFAFGCSETGGRIKKRDIDVFGIYFGVVLWVFFFNKKRAEIQVFIVFYMVFVATKQG